MKVIIVGCGGIGTHLIPLVVNLSNDHEITVMDGDVFEEKNMDRQVFNSTQLDCNKAVAMSELYDVTPLPRWLFEPEQLESYDFIICVPDNNKARLVALEASKMFGIPLVMAGNEARSANAYYYHNCIPYADPTLRYPSMLEPEAEDAGPSCHERTSTVPQTRLANSMASAMASGLFMYWTETGCNLPDNIRDEYAPVEYIWAPSACKTIKTGELQ